MTVLSIRQRLVLTLGLSAVAVFAVVGVPSSFTWLVGGAALRPLLSDVRRQRDFNAFMATLLLSTAVWIVWSGAGQGGP